MATTSAPFSGTKTITPPSYGCSAGPGRPRRCGRGKGTYKSFPVQDDEHLYAVCRYAERNALRANLVERADQWRWGSLAQRVGRQRLDQTVRLCDWPIPRPRNWVGLVHAVQTEGELDALRRSVRRGCPIGDEIWQQNTAKQLGLEFTLRPRGRPRKKQ